MDKFIKMQILELHYEVKLGLKLRWNEIESIQKIARDAQWLSIDLSKGLIDENLWEHETDLYFLTIQKILGKNCKNYSIDFNRNNDYCLSITKLNGGSVKCFNVFNPHHFN